MQDSTISSDIVRFGAYEADLTAGELRKHGLRIHLQELPFRILTLVLQRPGEVITREELREKLWPADVHVDFEHSLNSAIKKLRTALNDDPERPRFIETIPRRGYRFIGTLEHTVTPSPGPPLGNVRPSRLLLILGSALALSIVSNVVFLASNSRNSDRERPIRRFSLQAEGQVTDAVISPDGRRVAYNTAPSHVLWIQDLEGHQPKQIASPTMGISWSPDGDAIVFRSRDGLTRMQADEGVPVLIGGGGSATLNLSNRWSEKDGNVLAELAPVGPNTLFEISSQGGSPRVLNLPNTILPRFPQYLPDRRGGRQILFQEARNGKQFVVAFDLQSARREVLTEGERPVYSPTGHVLFQRATVLWALPFSLETWKPTGHATVVEKNAVRPSISRDGTLVYIDPGAQQQQLVWRNRLGVEVGLSARRRSKSCCLSCLPTGSAC